jgi:DNA-directed RNA polymerase specialized sigma24 family protein
MSQRIDDSELMLRAGDLINKLGEDWRKVLQTEGAYVERAVKLGVPVGTVKSRLNRARVKLQQLINERDAQTKEAQPQEYMRG